MHSLVSMGANSAVMSAGHYIILLAPKFDYGRFG
jgi:hypothetical protein